MFDNDNEIERAKILDVVSYFWERVKAN